MIRDNKYFELRILAFNSYVKYLARNFSFLIRVFELATERFELVTCGFELVTRIF